MPTEEYWGCVTREVLPKTSLVARLLACFMNHRKKQAILRELALISLLSMLEPLKKFNVGSIFTVKLFICFSGWSLFGCSVVLVPDSSGYYRS